MTEILSDITLDLSPLAGMNVPHIDQYFGVWAIESSRFMTSAQMVRSIDLQAHVLRQQTPAALSAFEVGARREYPIVEGIAIIDLYGPLMKFVGSLEEGTSTVSARRKVRNAANDPAVSGILLRIDSPGGTVAGTEDLAGDVASAAKAKPVHTYFEDLGASAAYWVGSQAARITANSTAIVGSIGTFCVVYDMSDFAKASGIKVKVVRAGDFKGSGVPGTEVTDEQLAEYQRLVDTLNSHFLEGVKSGRRMAISDVRALADGRVWVGKEAVSKGLIDGVGSFDQAVAELRKAVKATSSKSQERSEMSDPTIPAAATFSEIVAACPGISPTADSQFIVDQLAKGSTAAKAGSDWVTTLKARVEMRDQELAAKDKELAELRAKSNSATSTAPTGGTQPSGVKPIPTTASESTESSSMSATEQFNAAVEREMAGGLARHAAHTKVCRAQPKLRQAMVEEANAARPSNRS